MAVAAVGLIKRCNLLDHRFITLFAKRPIGIKPIPPDRDRDKVSPYRIMIIIIEGLSVVTLAEHTSDHGKQTNSSTKEKGEHG